MGERETHTRAEEERHAFGAPTLGQPVRLWEGVRAIQCASVGFLARRVPLRCRRTRCGTGQRRALTTVTRTRRTDARGTTEPPETHVGAAERSLILVRRRGVSVGFPNDRQGFISRFNVYFADSRTA